MTQVLKILNAQVTSLQWIEQTGVDLERKMQFAGRLLEQRDKPRRY